MAAAGATASRAFASDAAPAPSAAPTPSALPSEAPVGVLRGVITATPAQARKHTVVYLENAPLDRIIDAKLDDIKLMFVPHINLMTAKGSLIYHNKQPFPDTAFSPSNERWDLGMVEPGGIRKRVFPNAGNYSLLCHLHPNQLAYLIVSPSSYFTQANKDGTYELTGVPEGTYEAVAWGPRMLTARKAVTIVPGREVSIDFELKRK